MKTVKVLMVCLGNICRSPLAEGVLKRKAPVNRVQVDSAGTSNYHIGEAPDPRSIAIADKYGIDIRSQRGRQFSVSDFRDFDLIYAMDRSNYNHIISMAPDETSKAKVHMILNEVFPGENMDVPDPYYGGDNGFDKVYKMLDQACDKILQKIL
ncbi:low molecular weight phosphotyrosine protein phosphatase [Robertkochia marina]|uniref:protein-tyrosine-phosphatase n=1 Tax=Robertkochia marina TaxID=1227945 RepID=A0A4S3M3I3_9FLAO|nr:low molecular weight protein-tyrosine-phosphatase [Robertkochia marina]THD68065.1 low molecular weight phosphotyrosine protein phosphatase [Robertkochia marina]TRZ42650.1 low molecular weight phosphotyrosine protein phosphatase [Robertkochia marina]